MNDTTSNLTSYELARFAELTQWIHWAVLLGISAAVVTFVVWCYRRDSHTLPAVTAWLLTGLRITAFCGLLFFFFDLQKKTEREVRENSRISILVDTSQSMGLIDPESSGSVGGKSRSDQVVEMLSEGILLPELNKNHDLLVYQFDEAAPPRQIATFKRTVQPDREDHQRYSHESALEELRGFMLAGAILAGLSLGVLIIGLVSHWQGRGLLMHYCGAASTVLLLAAAITMATGSLRNSDLPLAAAVTGDLESLPEFEPRHSPTDATVEEETTPSYAEVPWSQELQPSGLETRIGDAVAQIVTKERGGPFSGMVVITDGVSNAGIELPDAIRLTREVNIPVITIGIGSDQRPSTVRIVDVEAPAKALPGDAFRLRGYIQGFGMPQEFVTVQLASGTTTRDGVFQEQSLEGNPQRVQLGTDGEVVPIDFDVIPDKVGDITYQLQIVASSAADLSQRDKQKSAKVQIVDRKSRVLLMAGGPMREFRFLRNQLFRDKDIELHVYLQTGRPGISQESDKLLFDFPDDAATLFEEYDTIIAFDPDWTQLDAEQSRNLERWVSEKAGGLVLISGPVNMPDWASQRRGDANVDLIRGLYPVRFFSRGASLGLDRYGSETPRKLSLTPDGAKTEFLLLDEDPSVNAKIWEQFAGVYGYYAVSGVKPGGTILATFDNTDSPLSDQSPLYMASHFYGAGRVVFLGSGEMWRIRSMDDAYFERFYTKLIRYVSQGRLMRDSSRGLLMVSSDRVSLGETVDVRAHLTDQRHAPLTDPLVEARLIRPDGEEETLVLRQLEQFETGQYSGRFAPRQDGDYRIELQLDGGTDDSLLAREVRARIPDREIENPERDDAALAQLAENTGGTYFVGTERFLGSSLAPDTLSGIELAPRDMFTSLPDLIDRDFQQLLRAWLLGLIALTLTLEWVVRRLVKLA